MKNCKVTPFSSNSCSVTTQKIPLEFKCIFKTLTPPPYVCLRVCLCVHVSVYIPESAVEPHSLAMTLPVRRSSTRQLNWQLGERRQGDMVRRGDRKQEDVSGTLKDTRRDLADMSTAADL